MKSYLLYKKIQGGDHLSVLLTMDSTIRVIAGQFEISCVQANSPFIDLVLYNELLVLYDELLVLYDELLVVAVINVLCLHRLVDF